jgi:hypothetical protein
MMGVWGTLTRYRLLIGFAGFVLLFIPLISVDVSYPYYFVRLDYILVASLILVTIAVVLEIYMFREVSIASTLLLEFLGVLVMWFTRIYFVIYVFFFNSFNFYIGGFTLIPQQAVVAYIISFAGATLSFSTMILHRFTHKPLVLAQSISFDDTWRKLVDTFDRFLNHPVAIGFTIGFVARFIPEFVWGYRLIGYDTVSYAAHLRDFVYRPSFFGVYWWMGGLRNAPPLLNWLLYPFAFVVDSVTIFKVYPAIAYGILSALIALYSVKVLGLSRGRAVAVSFVACFSLLSLRMSWDLQKQVLAQIFILTSLIFVELWREDPVKLLMVSPVLVLASLASEFGAALAIIISILVLILYIPKLKKFQIIAITIYIGVAIASYTLISWYLRVPVIQNLVIGYAPPIVGEAFVDRSSVYPYILISLGPLAPLYLIALEKLWRKIPLSITFSSLLLLLGLAPLLMPWTSFSGVEWDRVLMSISHIFVALSISQLSMIRSRVLKTLYILFLITPGVFMVGPEGVNDLNSVLVSALKRFPRGLTPATPDITTYDAAMAIAFKASNIGRPVIADPWIERFLHLYIRNPRQSDIIVVPQTNPPYILCAMYLNNLSKAFTITSFVLNTSTNVEVLKDFCLTRGSIISTNTTILKAKLNIKTIAIENPYKLIEIDIENIEEKHPKT